MGNKRPKSLEALLKRPGVGLDEVLEVESVLSKARTGDATVQGYFGRGEVLHGLLSRLVQGYDSAEKAMR